MVILFDNRCSDGVKLKSQANSIFQLYSDENKLQKMIKINDNVIIVTDQMGSVPYNPLPSLIPF